MCKKDVDSVSNLESASVISKVNGHTYTGKIEIAHHQSMLFIKAPQEPYDRQEIRDLIKGRLPGSPEPVVDLALEGYVRMQALSSSLQKAIREYLKV